MRKLLSIFIVTTAFCFIGCMDTNEEVTINADGSGVFKNTVDMSGMFPMLQMTAMMDTSAKAGDFKKMFERDIDSTVYLDTYADTASQLSAEERKLLRDGSMHMTINQSNQQFVVVFTYPFKKLEDIEKILVLQKNGKGFNPFGNSSEESEMSGVAANNDYTDMHFEKGLIERKVSQQKIDDLKNKEELKDAQGLDEMFSQITFSTAIRLPGKVKKAQGENLTVSDDKKTVTVKYTMLDVMNNPDAINFKVEY